MKELAKTQIIGVGAAIPEKHICSDDLLKSVDSERRIGVPHNFISKNLGIIQRRSADLLAKPSDLAIEASINAMSQSGVEALDIDLIVFCGIDRDWIEPATAHRVQDFLGAKNAYCFDVSNACHGIMNGLDVANSKIKAGEIETALVCSGEKTTDIYQETLDYLNTPSITREEFMLRLGPLTLGDAGGALIVRRCESVEPGIDFMKFYSSGQHAELCYWERHGKGMNFVMDMENICNKTFNLFGEKLGRKLGELRQSQDWFFDDIDHMVSHQIGTVPHIRACRMFGIDRAKATCTYPFLGNITSTTIAVGMALTNFSYGDKILIQSAGSGISIGSSGMVCSYDNNVNPLHATLNHRIAHQIADSA